MRSASAHYDTAVLEAFKQVEITTRDVASLGPGLTGLKLAWTSSVTAAGLSMPRIYRVSIPTR
jgi:hypothetical protein